MKGLTRRELLSGVAAGTALAAFGPLAPALLGGDGQSGAAPFQRVNILFHGRMVIDFGGEEVSVYPAAAGSGYAFLAGTWQQETNLAAGAEYRFSGVMTGPRPELRNIDPRRTAVFHRQPVDMAASFCRLVFPFPDFVTPLRPIHKEHGRHFFAGMPSPVVAPETLPEVVVFSYLRPDLTSRLECRPLNWTPVILGGIVNLHVSAAPAQALKPDAAAAAFAQMAKLMGTPQLRMNSEYANVKMPRPEENPETPGVTCSEELTLMERLTEKPVCGTKNSYHPQDAALSDLISMVLY